MAHDSEPMPSLASGREKHVGEPQGSLKSAFVAGFVVTCLVTAAVKVLMAYGAHTLPWSQANAGAASKVFPVDFAGEALVISGHNVRRIARASNGGVEQVELAMAWPPSEQALILSTAGRSAPRDLRDAVFLTLKRRPNRVDTAQRLHVIYPYYFESGPADTDHGLKMYRFKANSPYAGQFLYVGTLDGAWTTMRCDVTDSDLMPAMCRRELHLWGDVTVTYRFHRSHLPNWRELDVAVQAFLANARQRHEGADAAPVSGQS